MTEKQIYDFFIRNGLSPAGACGLMGNLYAESGFKSNNLQNSYEKKFNVTDDGYTAAVDGGLYPGFATDKAGYGLAQWTSSGRKQALLTYAKQKGVSIADFQMQLDFIMVELSGSYKSVLAVLQTSKSVENSAEVVMKKYERPQDQSDTAKQKRAAFGLGFYNKFAAEKKEVKETMNTNTATTINQVIAIAAAEVGYLEKSAVVALQMPAVLDDKVLGAGSDNYTKYARDLIVWVGKPYGQGAAWCDAFVDWCFIRAFGVVNAKKLLNGFSAYTPTSAQYFKNAKRWYTTNPQPGDQIFFKNEVRICHTGLVYQVDEHFVYTIEGNTSDGPGVIANGGGVCKKKYAQTNEKIAGYGRPDYSIISSPAPVSNTSTTTTVKIDAAESRDDSLAGSYTVSLESGSLHIRSGAGKDKPSIGLVPAGSKVHCFGYYTEVDGVKWLLVKTKEQKTGYCSTRYLQKN